MLAGILERHSCFPLVHILSGWKLLDVTCKFRTFITFVTVNITYDKSPFKIYAVTYLLEAKTVEPEKQPLLANGSETTFVSSQRPRNKRDKRQLLGSDQRLAE
jgi:hypothetical protein